MSQNTEPVRVTGGDWMNLFRGLYGFFASHKTPDSSFYLTALTVVGFLGTTLTQTASPVLIAAGTALVTVYTLGHKLADGMAGQQKSASPQETAQAVTDKLMAKSVDLSVRLPAPAMPTGPLLTPEQAAAIAAAAVAGAMPQSGEPVASGPDPAEPSASAPAAP